MGIRSFDAWIDALDDAELDAVLAQLDGRELQEVLSGVPAEWQDSLERAYTTFGLFGGLRRSTDELRRQAKEQLRDPKGLFREMRARLAAKIGKRAARIGEALRELPGTGREKFRKMPSIHDTDAWASWRGQDLRKFDHIKFGAPDGDGSFEEPIDVRGDIDRAIEHIANGRHVRLNSELEAATLMDRLVEIGNDPELKSKHYDLCKVSVPGTNLFCAEHKGIPRIKMPQVAGDVEPGSPAEERVPRDADGNLVRRKGSVNTSLMDEFRVRLLDGMGIGVEDAVVQASHLRASQNELRGINVAGIMRAIQTGRYDPNKGPGIFVTKDGYVIDGHHRWAAVVAANLRTSNADDLPMKVQMLDMDVAEALDLTNAYVNMMGIRPKAAGSGGDARAPSQRMADGEADLRRMISARTGMRGKKLDAFITGLKKK